MNLFLFPHQDDELFLSSIIEKKNKEEKTHSECEWSFDIDE